MQIQKKQKFILFVSSKEDSFQSFYNQFLIEEQKHEKENIIVEISSAKIIKQDDLLSFLDIAIQKRENGTSFVIVNNDLNIDDYPEEINIVPTLEEAEDIIDMEAMERELGF